MVTPLLHFQCPHCTGVFQVDPATAGQQVTCPTCSGVVTIGAIAPPEEAASDLSPPTQNAAHSGINDLSDSGEPLAPTSGAAHTTEAVDTVAPASTASAPGEQLGCPHCGGAFQVTADMAGQQMGCPHCGGVVTIPGPTAPGSPVVPEGALLAFRVQETPKKIILGDRVVEVRRLTAEEKAARRLFKRTILICICGAILVGAMLYLSYRGLPWR